MRRMTMLWICLSFAFLACVACRNASGQGTVDTEGLRGAIAGVDGDVQALSRQINGLGIERLRGSIAGIDGDVQDLSAKISDLERQIGALRTSGAPADDGRIAGLERQIGELTASVHQLGTTPQSAGPLVARSDPMPPLPPTPPPATMFCNSAFKRQSQMPRFASTNPMMRQMAMTPVTPTNVACVGGSSPMGWYSEGRHSLYFNNDSDMYAMFWIDGELMQTGDAIGGMVTAYVLMEGASTPQLVHVVPPGQEARFIVTPGHEHQFRSTAFSGDPRRGTLVWDGDSDKTFYANGRTRAITVDDRSYRH